MYQIDNSSVAPLLPASTSLGTVGFFTDGNPATGTAPTIVPAEFLNMLMLEVLGVLSAAGVTPSKTDFTQLATAIRGVNRQAVILTDTGTAGAYAAVNSPALTALPTTGYAQWVNISHPNPGAATYSPDGLAAKPIYGLGLQALQGGELPVGIAVLRYLVQAGVNGGNGAWIITESLGGAVQVAPGTAPSHAATIAQLQSGSPSFAVDTGVANAYVCAFTPALTARSESVLLRVKVKTTNTTACTINDGLGVVPLVGGAHAGLQGGEMFATGDAFICWNASVGTGSYVLLFCTGAPEQVAPATQGQQAVNAGQIQTQSLTAFTSTGTAPAFILTPVPAITAYAAAQCFQVTFSAAGGATPTLNVSGAGAKNLKQYDSGGNKVSAVITSGKVSDVVYDGTDFVVLDQLPSSNVIGIQGSTKNLAVSTTAASSVVNCVADEIIVESSSNTYQVLRAVSLSPNLTTAGANGLDTGSLAASTWYSVWVIWNGTTVAGLFSLSQTAPTMPSGYTHKARVGWVRTDGTANKYPLVINQRGRSVRYIVAAGSNVATLLSMAAGTAGNPATPTYAAVSAGLAVPPTATRIIGTITNPGNNYVAVAPNGSYGVPGSATNPPPVTIYTVSGNGSLTSQFDLLLESTNIYWVSNSSSGLLLCMGWEDNV
jgi:hypothetical protein